MIDKDGTPTRPPYSERFFWFLLELDHQLQQQSIEIGTSDDVESRAVLAIIMELIEVIEQHTKAYLGYVWPEEEEEA